MTGGPSAGKSKFLISLKRRLKNKGRTVFVVSEAATDFINCGLKDALSIVPFNRYLTEYMIERMNIIFRAIIESDAPNKVIILDRAEQDNKGYIEEEMFLQIIKEFGLSEVLIRDSRITAVVHLQTAAAAGKKFYSRKNKARRESPQEAIEQDKKTLSVWIGHPHVRFIPANPDVKKKLYLLLKEIYQILGIPYPKETEKKFLVEKVSPNDLPVPQKTVKIVQYYIHGESGKSNRIRKRGDGKSWVYFFTKKVRINKDDSREEERVISREEFARLLQQRDMRYRVIVKHRTCFMYEGQYFELDLFKKPVTHLYMLEIELRHKRQKILLPPFIKIIREVTHDPKFSNRNIALRKLRKR